MKTIHYHDSTISPSKVVCVGRNYVEHIHELNNEVPENMVLFNKPNSAISDTLYYIQEDCRFEGEICFLIQNNQIAGIGFGLDLTKANTQQYLKEKGLPWERAKGFDKSAVLSDFVPFSGPLDSLDMQLFINGTLAQHATYDLMIYKPQEIVDEILSFISLEDGDIIMSGTPKGVATYKKGDVFEAKISSADQLLIDARFEAL